MFVENRFIDEKCILITGTEINKEMNRLYFGGKKLPFNSYNRLF